MADHLRTLFLHPPSFQGFDGGAGARYQARREIRSFWYPTWLAQTAALVAGSRLVDAPPAGLTLADVTPLARDYDLAVLHTSAASFAHDVGVAESLKRESPRLRIGFVGAHVAVERERALGASPAIEFVAGNEFDFTIQEIAQGRSLASVAGLSYRVNGHFERTPERAPLENMDALPVEVHLLPLAADCGRPSLSHALGRARRGRDRAGHAPFPEGEGVLLRRRHVHGRPAARRGDRARARAPGRHLVVQREGERAGVHASRVARQRTSPAAGRLRVR